MSKAKKYWLSLMHDLSVPTSIWQPFWQDLEQRYREAHRHYHRLKQSAISLHCFPSSLLAGSPETASLRRNSAHPLNRFTGECYGQASRHH